MRLVLTAVFVLLSVAARADDDGISQTDRALKESMDVCAKHPHQLVTDGPVNREINAEFAVMCMNTLREWDQSGAHARYDELARKDRQESIGSVAKTLKMMDEATKAH